MNTTEFKRMLIDNCNLKPGGHNVWWRAKTCPFCGNSKWKFYLYINVNDDSSVGYDCKRCNQKSSVIDQTVLNGLGIYGEQIPQFKGVKYVKRTEEMFNDIVLLPEDADISKIQNYVYSRVGVVPTFDDLRLFQYVADPIKYCKMLSNDEVNKNKFINRFCFKLSNGGLTCRYHNDSQIRWIKHSVVKNCGRGLYVLHNNVNPNEPINVAIAEGVFDIIGLYYHGNIKNCLYISTQGTNYASGLYHILGTGIFGSNVSVGIYKDGNVKNYEIRYDKRFKKLFKSITIYENIIESDYGHPKDKIEIHKALSERI